MATDHALPHDPDLPSSALSGGPDTGRRPADWYELFFDLVFVVVIAVAAGRIEHDVSVATVGIFTVLFFPFWWAWVNLMLTNNLFGRRFSAIGALLICAMPGPAAMAISMAAGIGAHAWLYALGAAWIRMMVLVMWLIAHHARAISTPLWRVLTYNLSTACMWAVSAVLPGPYRYIVWGVAVAGEVTLLAVRSSVSRDVYERVSIAHGLERVGLFVVIVIGEAVYLSVTELASGPTARGGAAALFGLVICALLARAFFRWGAPTTEAGLTTARSRRSYGAMRDVVMYLPFFLITGLTLIAAAIGIAVAEDGTLAVSARVVLAAGISVFYLVNALAGLRLGRPLRGIATLVIPGIMLPTAACLLTGALEAWATLAAAALALALLDGLNMVLGHRAWP